MTERGGKDAVAVDAGGPEVSRVCASGAGTRGTEVRTPEPTVPGPGPIRPPLIGLRRWIFFGLVGATTLFGIGMLGWIMSAGGMSLLEVVILALFAATFGWISFAFWTAVIGFVLLLLRRDALTLQPVSLVERCDRPVSTRTALVMPVYNEDPFRVVSGLAAILRSLEETGEAHHFDIYLLSDTTDPETARDEETAWAALRRQFDGPTGLYYRRRRKNVGRKAGNIADFCRRWGTHYDFMVVLDADSIMSGSVLVELVRAMEANPEAGLIQTVPVPARQDTLFGRILQFARTLYGPMVASGLSFWQADTGNYWGHNAIVRVHAFTEHCGLPVLPGRPPLGGEILSHDFVEVALLRRAGWKAFLLPTTEGSYEEVPGNILDYAKRDRRWSQGNLQHLRLLSIPGLHSMNRVHFLVGAMGYLSSSLWLVMLLFSTAHAVLRYMDGSASLRESAIVVRDWPLHGASPVITLLVMIIAVLFLPKLLALLLAVVRHPNRFGGAGPLVASALVELVFTLVVAPLMMVYHGRFVASILSGRSVSWDPQSRDGRDVSWSEAWRRTSGITAVGVTWAAFCLHYSPGLLLWLSPVLVGLLFAAPLVRWTSRRSLGDLARRSRLFLVPSEIAPSPVLQESAWAIEEPEEVEAVSPWSLPPERPRAMVTQVLDPRWGT